MNQAIGPPAALKPQRRREAARSRVWRRWKNIAFHGLCLGVTMVGVLVLLVFLAAIAWFGATWVSWDFLTSPTSSDPRSAGLWPALIGTVWICAICAVVALPLGVATAVFLEEFRPRHGLVRKLHGFLQLNITNLAGVPSVVYGLIGLTVFATMFGLGREGSWSIGIDYYDQYLNQAYEVINIPVAGGRDAPSAPLKEGMTVQTGDGKPVKLNLVEEDEPFPDAGTHPELAARSLRAHSYPGRIPEQNWYYVQIPFGRGVLAGGLTLMLVILPIVIIASREALRAVPNSLRQAALAMGSTPWRVVRSVTLPAAMPGIMTGSIIAMSRALGEAAPLLMISGIVFIDFTPHNLMSDFTAMPLQIYNWAGQPQEGFHHLAAAGILVLLGVLLVCNGVAVLIRHKLQKPLS